MATSSPTTIIADESALLRTLIALMKQEQAFLISADTDGLSGLMQEKNQAVEQMAQLARQRHALLGAAGCEAGDAGMDNYLSTADSAARAAWSGMLALVREAKELNRLNGMLIARQMSNNEALIDAMRVPGGTADTAGVYGPTGQTAPGATTRRLVIG